MLRLRPHTLLGFSLAAWLLTSSTALATQVPPATQRCQNLTTGSFTPIARCISGNYFCVGSTPTPLVGVSADAACHIPLSDTTVCNLSNAKEVIDSIVVNNLNKMRLWVSLAGDSPVTSQATAHPFVKTAQGYWRLDRLNGPYFANLQNVVDYARLNNIKVEITFFAPWQGDFATGPWNNANGKVCVNTITGQWQPTDVDCTGANNVLQNAGFSNQAYFVQTAPDPINGDRPRQVQRTLINWIVGRLWCYDNVYWEIANEPESDSSVTPQQVQGWHTDMINQAVASENTLVGQNPGVTRRHRIAANPTKTAVNYISMANVDVVNGHYTEIFDGSPDVGLGAIELIRTSGNSAAAAAKLLGFNETKISAITGNAGTLPGGAPDSARAEGWEFMLNQGAIYDHWGYNYSSTNGQAAREQMRYLKNFMSGLPLRNLQRSGVDGSPAPPSWLPSLPNWATYRGTPLNARLFWAALQPTSTAATRVYALYLHNSLRRCQSGTETSTGCSSGYLRFNGYNPQIGTGKYRETLTLNLVPGTYKVEWTKPSTGASAQTPFNITYNADNSCTGGFSAVPCQIQSPSYDFDIALKLTQQP